MSSDFKEFLKTWAVEHRRSSPAHPESNIIADRYNGTLAMLLHSLTKDNPENWDSYLPMAVYSYNVSWNETIKATPYYLVFGIDPNLSSWRRSAARQLTSTRTSIRTSSRPAVRHVNIFNPPREKNAKGEHQSQTLPIWSRSPSVGPLHTPKDPKGRQNIRSLDRTVPRHSETFRERLRDLDRDSSGESSSRECHVHQTILPKGGVRIMSWAGGTISQGKSKCCSNSTAWYLSAWISHKRRRLFIDRRVGCNSRFREQKENKKLSKIFL